MLAHLSLQVRHVEGALGTALAADSLESCHNACLAGIGRTGRRAEMPRPGTLEANVDYSWVSLRVDEDQRTNIRTAVDLTEGRRNEGRRAGRGYTFRYLDLDLLFENDGFPDLSTAVALSSTSDGASFHGWRPAMYDREASECDGDFHGRYIWAVEVTALCVICDNPRSDYAWSWHSLFHDFLHVDAPLPTAGSASVDDRDHDGILRYPLFFDACL